MLSLGGATAAQIGIAYLEQGASALVPYVKSDLGLSTGVAGLYGIGVNVGRAVSALPSALPVERWGERRAILAGGVAGGLCAIVAAVQPFGALALALLVAAGAAQSVALTAGIMAIATRFRVARRGTAMGIRQAAVPAAGMVAAATLPALAIATSWRPALACAGAVAIVLSVGGAWLIRDEPHASARVPRELAMGPAVRAIVRDRTVARTIAVGTALAGAQFATLPFVQLYLVEELGISLHAAAVVLLGISAAALAGRLAWGIVSDLAFRGRRAGVLAAILALAALGAAGMAVADRWGGVALAVPMALLLGFTVVGAPGIYLAQLTEVAAPTLGSLTIAVAQVPIQGVALVVPPLFGGLVDATGGYTASWAMLAGLCLAAVPAAVPGMRRAGG
jgi:sugar phosphate permease